MADVGVVARSVVGLLLLAAAAAKARDLGSFRQGLSGYGVRGRLAGVTAWVVPTVEAVLGVLLIAGLAVPAAAASSALLFGVFSGVQLRTYLRGSRVPCHCFGEAPFETVSWATVARGVLLVLLSLLVLLAPGHVPSGISSIAALAPIAVAGAVVLRAFTVIPIVAEALRAKAKLAPTPTRGGRVSFRAHGLDVSLVPTRRTD
jgi:Methylamine utilisation protein MauE